MQHLPEYRTDQIAEYEEKNGKENIEQSIMQEKAAKYLQKSCVQVEQEDETTNENAKDTQNSTTENKDQNTDQSSDESSDQSSTDNAQGIKKESAGKQILLFPVLSGCTDRQNGVQL